jgi:hypothetical protein
MFNELFHNFIITILVVCILTAIGVTCAIKFKWKLINYIFLLLIPILGFPIIIRCVNGYYYPRYNYRVISDDYAGIKNSISNKLLYPQIFPNGSKYDLYHTSYEWYYRCTLKDVDFNKLIDAKSGIYGVSFVRNSNIDVYAIHRMRMIDTTGFSWDEKYESKVNLNGSRVFILRNSQNGDMCVYRNRF